MDWWAFALGFFVGMVVGTLVWLALLTNLVDR